MAARPLHISSLAFAVLGIAAIGCSFGDGLVPSCPGGGGGLPQSCDPAPQCDAGGGQLKTKDATCCKLAANVAFGMTCQQDPGDQDVLPFDAAKNPNSVCTVMNMTSMAPPLCDSAAIFKGACAVAASCLNDCMMGSVKHCPQFNGM